jgi:hypothetical protein
MVPHAKHFDGLFRSAALRGYRDGFPAGEIICSERSLEAGPWILYFHGSSTEHQSPAVAAASRPNINDVVCATNHGLFMLDDDEGVSFIAQGLHDVHQPSRVARVQPDRRLIHDEKRINQRGAQAGGEIDALDLAAG